MLAFINSTSRNFISTLTQRPTRNFNALSPRLPKHNRKSTIIKSSTRVMSNIYQQIIDIDVNESSGLPALLKHEPRNEETGYIIVTESERTSSSTPRKLFAEVKIPVKKQRSYEIAKKLFDNYNIRGDEVDEITLEEQNEREVLIDYVVNTSPMKLARAYIEEKTGKVFASDEEWKDEIRVVWFHSFKARSGDPSRNGFEHVMLGEWNTQRNIVGGFHWWYYYFINRDELKYKGAKYGSNDAKSGITIPEVATMEFEWEVEDDVIIKKSTGGFFVGPSVEGMLAMGMVRRINTTSDSDFVIVHGMELDIRMYKSEDGKDAINTFYPILVRVISGSAPLISEVDDPEIVNAVNAASGIRILSIVANPEGSQDTGKEKVTLINLYGGEMENISGWRVQGPNRSALVVGDVSLAKGEAVTLTIRKSDGLQLSNKGGEVKLIRNDGVVVQKARYDRAEAKIQGAVLLWDGKEDFVVYKQ